MKAFLTIKKILKKSCALLESFKKMQSLKITFDLSKQDFEQLKQTILRKKSEQNFEQADKILIIQTYKNTIFKA